MLWEGEQSCSWFAQHSRQEMWGLYPHRSQVWSWQWLTECLVLQSVLQGTHVELYSMYFAFFLSLPASLQRLSLNLFSVLVISHHQWHLDLFLFHPLPCFPLCSESQKGCFSQSLNVGVCTPQERQIRRKIQQTAVWQFEIKREVVLWILILKLFFVNKNYICSSYKILFYKYEVHSL